MLEVRSSVTYTVSMELHARVLSCLYPGCEGHLRDGWMMRRHFWDVHSMDLVKVPKEGKFDLCKRCGIQVHPILCTPDTGIPRNAKLEWSRNISGRQGYRWHWLSGSRFWYVAMCWNGWKSTNILDASWRRMIMTFRPFAPRCGKPEPPRLELDRFFGARMLHLLLPPSSIRQ